MGYDKREEEATDSFELDVVLRVAESGLLREGNVRIEGLVLGILAVLVVLENLVELTQAGFGEEADLAN